MARINIEEESWKRVYRLSELTGVSVREALGTVGCLWGNSQDLVKTHGTKDEIIEWASLFGISAQEVEKFILGLEKVRFISLDENGLFKIHGNEIQLENRISKTSRASKGGQALKKKLRELKRLKAGLKPATSTLEAGSKGLNALQGNAIQNNAIQNKTNKPEKLEFDFELLYEMYPNKVNRSVAFERLDQQIKTPCQFNDFKLAIENYKKFLGLEKNKSWLKAKNFDVFVGTKKKKAKPWVDWINPDPSVFEDSAPTKPGFQGTRAKLEDLEAIERGEAV